MPNGDKGERGGIYRRTFAKVGGLGTLGALAGYRSAQAQTPESGGGDSGLPLPCEADAARRPSHTTNRQTHR